jgi:putative ABC transport system permease protein
MTSAPHISTFQLALGLIFILMAGGASLAFGLRLGRDLAVGTLRTFAQLMVMGYALTIIFDLRMPVVTFGLFLIMTVAATQIVHKSGGSRRGDVPIAWPTFVSMLGGYSLVAWMVCDFIIGAQPWWEPRVFLPMAGMVIGNSMTAQGVALERLFGELASRRELVEMQLAHGASPDEASSFAVREAIRAGMIPSITSLMGVGLVFLPGMMTGQILAGADPMEAVRYQIVVMLMVVGATATTTVLAVLWVRRRCFDRGQRLRPLSET